MEIHERYNILVLREDAIGGTYVTGNAAILENVPDRIHEKVVLVWDHECYFIWVLQRSLQLRDDFKVF